MPGLMRRRPLQSSRRSREASSALSGRSPAARRAPTNSSLPTSITASTQRSSDPLCLKRCRNLQPRWSAGDRSQECSTALATSRNRTKPPTPRLPGDRQEGSSTFTPGSGARLSMAKAKANEPVDDARRAESKKSSRARALPLRVAQERVQPDRPPTRDPHLAHPPFDASPDCSGRPVATKSAWRSPAGISSTCWPSPAGF
jgi:hypothetical protein